MTQHTFEQRKRDHIRLALKPENEATGGSGLSRVHLQHEALPDLDFNEISIESTRLSTPCSSPFLVSSMTAGHADAVNINHVLLEACQQTGWAMGVGSQRRQLNDPSAKSEWATVRDIAPDVFLLGNLGIAQVITTPISQIQTLVESLQANALFIHLNALQECMQPEGTPQFKQGLDAITSLANELSVPVIIKETGCGFSESTLNRLKNTGIAAVDISGFGGTHWGRIEGDRAESIPHIAQAAQTFAHWGISTVDSLLAARSIQPNYEIWASGGIRSGLDAAKCIALGANMVGFAKPMLQAALKGTEAVIKSMRQIEYELKVTLFCTGSKNLTALSHTVRSGT